MENFCELIIWATVYVCTVEEAVLHNSHGTKIVKSVCVRMV